MNYTYILASRSNSTIYVGVTSNLPKRLHQHKTGYYEGFTKRYNVHKLVYFEPYQNIIDAIKREKQIKKYRREKKDALINSMNPEWKELDFSKT